jgi:hypothetical protein
MIFQKTDILSTRKNLFFELDFLRIPLPFIPLIIRTSKCNRYYRQREPRVVARFEI